MTGFKYDFALVWKKTIAGILKPRFPLTRLTHACMNGRKSIYRPEYNMTLSIFYFCEGVFLV